LLFNQGMNYEAPIWLSGGHQQTIWAPLFARRYRSSKPVFRRERWDTPDGDFIDVDHLVSNNSKAAKNKTQWVMFHGLEGSSQSHYCESFADVAQQKGHDFAVVHFRGCSGTINLAPRAYHSGDFEEIAWILQRLKSSTQLPVVAVGISLGGNALLRWAEESGKKAEKVVKAAIAICSPLDLAASGKHIGVGFNKHVYTRRFLNTMKPKALKKWEQYPGLFDREALLQAQDLYSFDNIFTAPLHGFKNTEDYWSRCSSKPHLKQIKIPALVINSKNDPFIPKSSLPKPYEVGQWVRLWQPAEGGHVGFTNGSYPGNLDALPINVMRWVQSL
jgi:predicted alpha/beta-fold hydrolase